MAATGKTPILLYGSTTATNAPTAGNLTNSSDGCEIAINVADKNLFFKDSTNTVNTVPIRQSSASSNGWLSSTDWSTFNGKQAALVSGTNIKTVSGTSLLGSGDVGTINVSYGGTGLTSLTAGYIPYGNGTSAFSSSANLTFNGSALSINTASAPVGSFLLVNGASGVAASVNTSLGTSGSTALQLGAYGNTTNSGTTIRAYTNHGSNSNSALAFEVNGTTEVMRLFTSTGVSIGNTTDPGATNLYVTGKISAGNSPTTAKAYIEQSVGGSAGIEVNNTDATNTSTLFYGRTTAAAGTGFDLIGCYANGATEFRVRGDGTIYAVNTTVQSASDERMKENIVDAPDGLNTILNIRPVRFDFKEGFGNNKKNQLGFIAQEIEQVFPDAVDVWGESDDPDKPYKSVGPSALIPVLVKAIQELEARLKLLENK